MSIKEFLDINEIGTYKEEESMALHTTYKVGGVCKYYVMPSNKDKLTLLVKFLKENNVKYKVLGNCSNVIISDEYFDGVIISLRSLDNLKIDGTTVEVEAGYPLIKLSMMCANNSLTGFEFAAGIPGNIGGSIYMNAGAYKSDMSTVLETVTFLDEDFNVKTLRKEELEFGYRTSLFKSHNYIILSAVLKLANGDKDEIIDLIEDRRSRRITSQPLEYPSAGSVFRNPSDTVFAGKLIEDLGLKGYSIGGAKISEKHANFIINYNNATASDIKELIDYTKAKVKEQYDIELKVEQEFINF